VEEARGYLAANNPPAECEAITNRLLCGDRKRSVTICTECQKHVGDDMVISAPQGEMRLCDYVVDPAWCSERPSGPAIAHERHEGALPPGSASGEVCSRVLGHSVEDFASAVAALTDHEEMVLALVHPLVQVYTIPRTGQLAYVGHICNFRQKVAKFLSSLPVMPADMPVVHVRPRKYKGNVSGKALFKVDVHKLRRAFQWLRDNNPYYANVEWREEAATAWEADDVQVGTTREADDDSAQAPPVSRRCFDGWIQHAQNEAMAGDCGYAIGKRLHEIILETHEDDAEPVSESAADLENWTRVRRMVAEVFGRSAFRMATALPQDILAVALAARGILDLGLPQYQDAHDTLRALRSLDTHSCPLDLTVFRAELDAVMLELSEEDPEVVHAGATASAAAGDDVGLRESVLDSLAAAAQQVIGEHGAPPVSDSACLEAALPAEAPPAHAAAAQQVIGAHGAPAVSAGECPEAAPPSEAARDVSEEHGAQPVSDSACPEAALPAVAAPPKTKYPRVDPPDVEDEPGQAIREDTPGYIAQAFPKLFPHGVGDYHGDWKGLRRTLRFEEWGRYVMLWHDGRFMRHTRFRYWLLDTMLRVMILGVQRTFFRTRKACEDYTLESLMDKQKRRELVQQMSTVTNLIRGPLARGERCAKSSRRWSTISKPRRLTWG